MQQQQQQQHQLSVQHTAVLPPATQQRKVQQTSGLSMKATTTRMMDELSRIRKARQKNEQIIFKLRQELDEQRQLGERKKQALLELQMRNEELANQLMESEGKRDLITHQV